MTYDVPFRHRQALDPSGLNTLAATLHALQAAARDCANAGASFESDPAVVLLARYLGALAIAAFPNVEELRRLCAQDLRELEASPLLVNLARRGVTYDADAKRAFHQQGRKALRALAVALNLSTGAYAIRVCAGGPAVSGEVILHTDSLYVQLTINRYGGGEILYRACRDRTDYCGGPNYRADIEALLDPSRLASRIGRDMRLPAKTLEAEAVAE